MVSGRKRNKIGKWAKALLIIAGLWLVQESRFYIPKHIRPPKGVQPIEVTMKTTAYCHCSKCCSYHWFLFIPYQKTGRFSFRLKHVGKTSSGAMVRLGTIAADTSVYPYGTVMYIPGYGYGRVEDSGGAIKRNHIDLYRPNHWYARHWGAQTKKVKVWLPAKKRAWSSNPKGATTHVATNIPPVQVSASNKSPELVVKGSNNPPSRVQETTNISVQFDAMATNAAEPAASRP